MLTELLNALCVGSMLGVTALVFLHLGLHKGSEEAEEVLNNIPETPEYMQRDDYLPGRDPVPFDDGHVQGRCVVRPVQPEVLLVPNDVFDLEDPLPDDPMYARVKPDWMKVLGRGVVRESKAKWN